MGLFTKRPKQQEPGGRRRPVQTDESRLRGSAFSYHAQRSGPSENIGRSTEHIIPRDTASDGGSEHRPSGLKHGLVVAGVVVAGVYLSLILEQPKVVLQSEGSSSYFLQDESVYQRSVMRVTEPSVLNNSKLTLDTPGIRRALLQAHPEVAAVVINKAWLLPAYTVTIIPQQPALVLTTSDSAAFLVDTNGRALISTSLIKDSGELSVPTLHDTSGLDVQVGRQALPRKVVRFVTEVSTSFKAKQVDTLSMTLPRSASELDVAVGGTSYFVKFNLQEDARQQIGTYLAVRDRLKRDKITPATYIDVRVPGRAYYK